MQCVGNPFYFKKVTTKELLLFSMMNTVVFQRVEFYTDCICIEGIHYFVYIINIALYGSRWHLCKFVYHQLLVLKNILGNNHVRR